MTQTTENTIQTRRDGSIDTNFYMDRGRIARANTARKLIKSSAENGPKTVGFLTVVLAAIGITGFWA